MATFTKKSLKTGIRWMAVIRTAEVPYLSKTFKTKDAARTWARRMEADADLARAEANLWVPIAGLCIRRTDIFQHLCCEEPN